jgi:lysophospholipase L1-like esterase
VRPLSAWRGNFSLAIAASTLTLVVVGLGFEARANFRYYRWKARYDNEGWIGRLTVASANPILLWEYRPNALVDGLATNRHGFRDVDYEGTKKSAGTRRVAFIGDSVTVGMGVTFPETFVQRVARAMSRDVQALNFGVDGYHALQLLELLRARVLAFEPDQVVYVMCLNDFDFTDSSGRKISYFRKPRSFLALEIEQRYRRLRGIDFYRYHFERNGRDVFRAMADMKRLLDERGVGFLVAIMPVFPEGKTDASYFAHYPQVELHQEIQRFCERSGIRVHDLLADFRRAQLPPDRLSVDVWHLTTEGHRLVAEGLLPNLLR